MFQIAALSGNAFIKAANMSTAINAFQKTGIWSCDPNKQQHAETTDIPMPAERVKRTSSPATPGCSGWSSKQNIQASTNDIVASTLSCSLEGIVRIPCVGNTTVNRPKRKKGKTTILTSTRYKNELQQ
ncbi:hypothetical protein QE152_g11032 [Popillia japonica]|uniref:Uncharacterized protein n=1 Tax=Popillia japonica TaxID=7064 RepID=A0AAW1LTC2_POPJA